MKIYTKTGDQGKTSLYDKTRISKNDIRVESYGTIDELNSYIGLARQFTEDNAIQERLQHIQRKLFNVAGELATLNSDQFPDRIQASDIQWLEDLIDTLLDKMGKEQAFQFIIPGSSKASASLHIARTICRRAERRVLTLAETAEVSSLLLKYINRLSDALYTMARYSEKNIQMVEFKK